MKHAVKHRHFVVTHESPTKIRGVSEAAS